MSKKTLLVIAASAELFLGAYFILAFFAWFAKTYLFTVSKSGSFSIMLVVWLVLAAASFVMYLRTRRKMKDLDSK